MKRTLFTNGNIYTLDSRYPHVEAIVAEEGKIVAVGSHQELMLQWARHDTKVIDLQGRMVTPGLIDSHLHISGIALTTIHLDFAGATSKDEMLKRIQEKVQQTKGQGWIVGRGWDENQFLTDTMPTIEELDRVAPHTPLFLTRICGHVFLVNTKALEEIHYDDKISVPEGGTIVKDPVTKKPTGLILETASQLFSQCIPELTFEELKKAVRKAMKSCIESGLTSVHTEDLRYLGGLEQTYRIYDELINEEGSKLRSNLLIYHPYINALKENNMKTGYGNPFLQIGAAKLFVDGALGGRTALLSTPYTDEPGNVGSKVHSEVGLYEIVKKAREHDMPIAAHVIGDKALEIMLDVLDEFPTVPYRDRLIHTQLLRPDLIERLKHPQRIADIQPRFLASDYPWVVNRFGEDRMELAYAWKTMIDAGIRCAGGSDAPVEPHDPLLGIHAAVKRSIPAQPDKEWYPKERLSMKEALELFTIGGAFATNEEHIKGTLSVGKVADMTVLSTNLFSMDPDELRSTKVQMTIIDGEVCFES